ncbi:MAG: hypothetical protein FJ388_18125, partial [Verrucomicrobia bacterium]|nr:hypothetical protein [Verrucomicrobiota bacterium]
MSQSRDTLTSEAQRPHCAYCDAPLPANAAKYCCYGCRVLGEAGRKPVALPETPTAPWFKIAVVAVLAGQA